MRSNKAGSAGAMTGYSFGDVRQARAARQRAARATRTEETWTPIKEAFGLREQYLNGFLDECERRGLLSMLPRPRRVRIARE